LRSPGGSSATRNGGSEARQRVVLGSVVGDEQRQLTLAGRPHGDFQRAAEHADADGLKGSRHARRLEPRRRLVPGCPEDGLLAERARRALRVVGIANHVCGAVVVEQFELVLETSDTRLGQLQHPTAVVANEVALGQRQVRAQADRRKARFGVFDVQAPQHRLRR
jgi:hypothetical protein